MNTSFPMFACLLLAFPGSVFSASIGMETFSAGALGWNGSVTLGGGGWSFTGGVARITFVDTTPVPIPDTGVLSNTPPASSGIFTGNYDAAGVEMIAFRVMAPTELPSGVVLVWGGSTAVFQRQFFITQTGVWVTCAASLADVDAGPWTVNQGAAENFDAARQDVRFVSVRIQRSGTAAQTYFIDDLVVDALPAGAAPPVFSGEAVTMRWDHLQTNVAYRLESATELDGAWTVEQHLTATNRWMWMLSSNTHSRMFWRLTQP
jgi:hypothetical protein